MSCERAVGVVRPTPLRSIVCGPCWAQHGGQAAAGETGPAPVQAVSVRDPDGQREWLERLETDPLVARRNAPTRRRLLALARELAYRAGWETHTSWPTWARLQATTGWARSTMAGWLRELRLHGWLATVEHGSTPHTRPMARAHVEGNRAATYALRVPLPADTTTSPTPRPNSNSTTAVPSTVHKTWTPTSSFPQEKNSWISGSSRARGVFHNRADQRAADQAIEALRARTNEEGSVDFAVRVPATKGQMLAAAAQLRRSHAILARLSPKAIRTEARPYWHAGWTNLDVLHALAYRPSATVALPTMRAEAIWHPAAWMHARLAAWRGPRGRVLPGLTQQQHTRSTVRARHGHGALAALPTNARMLTSTDVREHARKQTQQATATIARNHRRDRAERLRRPRPATAAASAEQRQAAHQHWHTSQPTAQPTGDPAHDADQTGAAPSLRQRLVAAAHAANHTAAATPGPNSSQRTTPNSAAPPHERADGPGSPYERARAKAKTEHGSHNQPRRGRKPR